MQSINYACTTPISRAAKSTFSETLRKLLGMKPDDPAFNTGNIIETIIPTTAPPIGRRSSRHLKGDTPRFKIDFRYRSGDGSWRWCRQSGHRAGVIPTGAPIALRRDGRLTESRQRDRELEPPGRGRRVLIARAMAANRADDIE